MEKPQQPLDERVSEFEQTHPEIAEAMRLFGITNQVYQEALSAMEAPRVFSSTSTTPVNTKHG